MTEPLREYLPQPLPENPLDNYERTPLGDWPMPASVDRNDPWMRLVLLGPERPLVIDLAVFIDGKPFRESSEAWIDELLIPEKGEAQEPASDEKSAADGNKSDEPSGTNRAERASEEAAAADGEKETAKDAENAKEEKEGDAVAGHGVPTQARTSPSMRERLVRYLATSGSDVKREEIRWLIAEWGAGPPVLTLGPSLSWQRAGFALLSGCLDADQDGALSAAEIAAANEKLQRADLDTNDVIEAEELRRAANQSAALPLAIGHSLVVTLDETTDWESLAATLDRLYGKQEGDVRSLAENSADVTLRVDLATEENQPTGISIMSVNAELGDMDKVVTATADVITLDLGADYVEFSAAQGAAGGQVDANGAQVAVGAVIDGNPLFRLVDRDSDQRLTLRERQELTGLFSALDHDGDGAVAAGEMPTPIRLAVTLGPRVHELLATPVAAARAITPAGTSPAAPAWFVSMDKNGDHDLSRGEFLGTTEQFRQFDADGDGLLSVSEARKLDPGQ